MNCNMWQVLVKPRVMLNCCGLLILALLLLSPLFSPSASAGSWVVTETVDSRSGDAESWGADNSNGYTGAYAEGFDNATIVMTVTTHITWVPDYPGDLPSPVGIYYTTSAYARATEDSTAPSSMVQGSEADDDCSDIPVITAPGQGYEINSSGDHSGYVQGDSAHLGLSFQHTLTAFIDTNNVETVGAYVGIKTTINSIVPL